MGTRQLSITLATMALVESVFGAGQSLPIREVTVFKDGHALVLHSGSVATDANGDVVLDSIPSPVLGTFWATESEEGAELRSVRASRVHQPFAVDPTTITELIEANIGARIRFSWKGNTEIEGAIKAVLGPPKASTTATGTAPTTLLPRDWVVVIETSSGEQLAAPLGQITSVTFLEGDPTRGSLTRFRDEPKLIWTGKAHRVTKRRSVISTCNAVFAGFRVTG